MHLSNYNVPPFDVNILVVDGDAIALNTTLQMLYSLKYKVEGTTKSSIAVDKLRRHPGHYQLIVTEVHMSDLDGFKLKQIVDQEFSIPIIMVSVENNEEIQRKAMMSGVVRYILKPAKPDDFIDIWQFAVGAMNDEMPSNMQVVGDIIEELRGEENHKSCSSFIQKDVMVEQKGDDMEQSLTITQKSYGSTPNKKAKIIWTKDLQSQFLKAIDITGGADRTTPTKILQIMNVQGLTRDNVGSHLQKYRLYIKDVERILSLVVQKAIEDNDVFLSNMVTTHRSLVLNLIRDDMEKNLKQSKMRHFHYLKSNHTYVSRLRSKVSALLRLNHFKHIYHSQMIPSVKMGLLTDDVNDLGGTNNTTKLYDQFLTHTHQLRSDSNLVYNSYNDPCENHPMNPSGSISYINNHGLGQTSSPNVTNCNIVTSFQELVSSSQMQPTGMLNFNSDDLVEGRVMSTASEVLGSNQNLPISQGDPNNVENIVVGGNLFQPQQQENIYNQGNDQTFASLGDNFDSQVTSNGPNLEASDDSFSIEDILNEFALQSEEAASTDISLNQSDNDILSFDPFDAFDQLEWDDNFIESILNDME